MSDLLAALNRGRVLVPATTAERWLELVHHPSEEIARHGCWGLARLATFEGAWATADPLLDLDSPDALAAALRTACVLDAREAIPRLRARLDVASDVEAVGLLRALDTLGDDARASLSSRRLEAIEEAAFDTRSFILAREKRPAELIASAVVTETSDRYRTLADRTGGHSRELELLASVAGEGSLTAVDVEAWRRRDADAIAEAIARLVDVDVAAASPRDVREVSLRRVLALACRETILEASPKRAQLDALAVAGLVQGMQIRARVRRDAASAVTLALLGDGRVWETLRSPDAGATPLVKRLSDSPSLRAREALVACALGWRLEAFAPEVVAAAREGSLLWGFVHGQLATRLEAPLLSALGQQPPADGTLSLLAQLVSTDAEQRVVSLANTPDLGQRLYLPLLVRSFPTPRVFEAVRRAPPVEEVELRRRFALLAELDPSLASLDLQSPALLCQACGAIWNVEPASLAQVGRALVPDPAVACPGCGEQGWAVGADPTEYPRKWRIQPTFEPHESPRDALGRFEGEEEPSPLDLVETLLLCGDRDRAISALQLLSPDDRLAQAPRASGVLLRLGLPQLARDCAVEALKSELAWAVWQRDDLSALEASLRDACAQLGEEPPRIEISPPRATGLDDVSIPSGKVGRNEPCPCGSGKKFKRCHGA